MNDFEADGGKSEDNKAIINTEHYIHEINQIWDQLLSSTKE